jgi:hypothetical protein
MPRWLAGLLFFVTVAVVWGGGHIYLYHRISQGFELGTSARLGLKILLPILAMSYLAGRMLAVVIGHETAMPVLWFGATWMGLVSLAMTGLVLFEVGFTLPQAIANSRDWHMPGSFSSARRVFLVAVLVATPVLGAWGFSRVQAGPFLRDMLVHLPGLPAGMDGFRLVVLSDIHVGEMIGPSHLDRIEAVVTEADGDLVVIVGDLTDERDGGDGTALGRLARLRSRLGVVAVTGNHEVYSGGDTVVQAIERAGMDVLRQRHRVIEEGFVLAGVDDPTFLGGKGLLGEAMAQALEDRPEGLPTILLSHQPLAVETAAGLGVDLMLCGHTHGGQIPPFHLLNRIAYPVVSGKASIGEMIVYVLNGTGFWGPPMRIGADSEVLRITLRSR